ncbi:MAG: hypothetical protein LBT47_05335, partial [Deltaproteobacteria bacterium]|nr:hypothetical protein [Deltaproteobacteria bacterium]
YGNIIMKKRKSRHICEVAFLLLKFHVPGWVAKATHEVFLLIKEKPRPAQGEVFQYGRMVD